MPIFVLFVNAGVLFDGAFPLWVSLINLLKFDLYQKQNLETNAKFCMYL